MNVPDPLAQHRMARARATLEEATLLLERGMLVGALNRVYYAAFYAARALLATRQLDSSRHGGVISLFQEHFVRTALVALSWPVRSLGRLKSGKRAITTTLSTHRARS